MKTLITLAALAALTLSTLVAQQTPVPAKAEQSATRTAKATPAPPPGAVTIEISLGQLAAARQSVTKLFGLDLPVKIAYGLRQTISVVEAELNRYNEQRNDLIRKHGKMKDGVLMVPVDDPAFAAFDADMKVLGDIQVKLTITPISVAALPEDAKLSASDMMRLERFLIP